MDNNRTATDDTESSKSSPRSWAMHQTKRMMAVAAQLMIRCVQWCTMREKQYSSVQGSESTLLYGLRVNSSRVVGNTLSRAII